MVTYNYLTKQQLLDGNYGRKVDSDDPFKESGLHYLNDHSPDEIVGITAEDEGKLVGRTFLAYTSILVGDQLVRCAVGNNLYVTESYRKQAVGIKLLWKFMKLGIPYIGANASSDSHRLFSASKQFHLIDNSPIFVGGANTGGSTRIARIALQREDKAKPGVSVLRQFMVLATKVLSGLQWQYGSRRGLSILSPGEAEPDAKDVRLDPETNTLRRDGVESIMNPFDRHALEEGVRLKEKLGGTVTAITMGPPQAEETLREAVSCGADEAVLVSDRAFAGADTWATTYTLAKAIETLGACDLILCGKQAIDGDTAQVGPGLAERLGIPYATYVKKIDQCEGDTISVERMMDDGHDVVKISLPALLTVVKEINDPRIPSLKGKMRAKKTPVKTMSAHDISAEPNLLGLRGSTTQVVRVFSPEARGERAMLSGDVDDIVAKLADILQP